MAPAAVETLDLRHEITERLRRAAVAAALLGFLAVFAGPGGGAAQAADDGRTLTLAGKTYEKGTGSRADSAIEVHTGGQCSKLTADVSIDDEINGYGEVAFWRGTWS